MKSDKFWQNYLHNNQQYSLKTKSGTHGSNDFEVRCINRFLSNNNTDENGMISLGHFM